MCSTAQLQTQGVHRSSTALRASGTSRRPVAHQSMAPARATASGDWTRADTPGTAAAAHFNAAGAALPTRQVIDAHKAFLDAESTVGGYEAVVEHADALRRPYDTLAALLQCYADEIAIVQSATTAWQQAFFGIRFSEGDRILTSVHEYATNFINFLQARKRYGVSIEVVPETEDGDIDLQQLEAALPI